MREVKFMVWDVEETCWVPQAQVAIAALDGHENILTYEEAEDRWIADPITFVLVEYSGLKDRNGREIYEEHIVQYDNLVFRIQYKDGGFGLYDQNDVLSHPLNSHCAQLITVIGHFFENPEFLEKN